MKYKHYYYSLLNSQEKTAYLNILNASRHFEKEAVLPPLNDKSCSKVRHSLIYDEPKLFFIYRYNQYHMTYYNDRTELSSNISMDRDMALELYSRIAEKIRPVLHGIKERTQQEQALYLHDYLVSNVTYGSPDTYPEAPYNILGAFLCNECVCAGFAAAYKFMLDKIGIPALIACGIGKSLTDGTSDEHAWNIIWLGGKPYHVDATFDELIAGKYCSRAYYLLSDAEIKYDHEPDEDFELPKCPESACPLKLVTGTHELMQYLKEEAARGADHTEVRLSRGFQHKELINDVIQGWFKRTNRSYFAQNPHYYYGARHKTLFIEWIEHK